MQIPTNKLGLLLAEVDSAGSLRLSGDRVLFGAKRSQSETEWLVRQKVAQCRQGIADIVHSFGGVVAKTIGDRVLCNLNSADKAAEAACAIQLSVAPRESASDVTSSVTTQMGVRIALHYDKLLVDGGRLSGPALQLIEALIEEVETDQIVATESFVSVLSPTRRTLAKAMAPMRLVHDAEPAGVMDLNWRSLVNSKPRDEEDEDTDGSSTTDRLVPPQRLAAGDEDDDPGEQDVTRITTVGVVERPGLMEQLRSAEPTEEVVAATRMTLRYKGRQIVLDAAHPTITLRSGPERVQHARISLRDDGFFVESLNEAGTHLRSDTSGEALCTDTAMLEGEGAISLGSGFDDNSQVIEYRVEG